MGFIDDDIRKQDRRFLGYPVLGGKDRLNEIVGKHHISDVIISFRNMDKGARDFLKRHCSAMGVNLSHLRVIID